MTKHEQLAVLFPGQLYDPLHRQLFGQLYGQLAEKLIKQFYDLKPNELRRQHE